MFLRIIEIALVNRYAEFMQAMTLRRRTPSRFCKSFHWVLCNVDFAVKRPLGVCVKDFAQINSL